MKRYKVRSKRNSICNYNVEDDSLDWSFWWTDIWHNDQGAHVESYLHVYDKDHDSIQRVRCRKSLVARIEMRDGELYWLVDRTEPVKVRIKRPPRVVLEELP